MKKLLKHFCKLGNVNTSAEVLLSADGDHVIWLKDHLYDI